MARKKWREIAAAIDNDPVRRAHVDEAVRAMDVVRELAQMREERGATQDEVAAGLGTSQPNVSRIEHEEDIFLSTLRDYIGALGGRLEVRAIFPDGQAVDLTPTHPAAVSEPAPTGSD